VLHHGLTPKELEHALEHDSGLAALGGLDEPLGFDVFTYRVAKAVAAMTAALGGLDALVFTAGIGENSARARTGVCERLAAVGVELDERANAAASPDAEIGKPGAPVTVWVIAAREDLVAARAARALLGN
jgi:acetate kinase